MEWENDYCATAGHNGQNHSCFVVDEIGLAKGRLTNPGLQKNLKS